MPEVWPFIPTECSAHVEFKTDVMKSIASEQRMKRRVLFPRLVLDLAFNIYEYDIFKARSLIEDADSVIDVPDFRYPNKCSGPFNSGTLTLTFDTSGLHVANTERAVAVDGAGNAHVFTVSGKTGSQLTASSGPTDTMTEFFVYPVFEAQLLTGADFGQIGPRYQRANFVATITNYKDLSAHAPSLDTYLTYNVVDFYDVNYSQVRRKVIQAVTMFDSGTGKIDLEQAYDHIDGGDVMSHEVHGVNSILEREGWLHAAGGQLTPFWRIGRRPDFELAAAASTSAVVISVTALRPSNTSYEGKHICIIQGANKSYHEITSATVGSPNVSLTITPALSFDIDPADVDTISEMNLVRLATDRPQMTIGQGMKMTMSTPVAMLDFEL